MPRPKPLRCLARALSDLRDISAAVGHYWAAARSTCPAAAAVESLAVVVGNSRPVVVGWGR